MYARISRYKLLESVCLMAALTVLLYAAISLSGRTVLLVLILLSAGVLIAAFLLKKPVYFILGYFLILPFALENPEGVSTGEIVFLSYTIAIAIFFLFLPAITGRLKLQTPLDKMFLLFTLMLPYASVLGLLNGAGIYPAIGELTYFAGVFIYFALRYYFDLEIFRKGLLYLIPLLLLFVIARNAYFYQEIIMQAYVPWQVEKARVASNEVLILFFTTLGTAAFVYAKTLKLNIASILFIGMGFLSLILTQSRGYWLAFIVSFTTIFLSVPANKKGKMLLYFSAILIILLGIAKIYFPEYFTLVFNALILRFQSIATSAQVDISLLERFEESAVVFSKIVANPILGYGFGAEYTKFIFFERFHISTSYVHNGYLAAWYKFGLFGLLLMLSIYISVIRNSYRIFKQSNKAIHKIVGLTILATLSGMLLVNNTSPQFLAFDSILLLTFMAAYCSEFDPRINAKELE